MNPGDGTGRGTTPDRTEHSKTLTTNDNPQSTPEAARARVNRIRSSLEDIKLEIVAAWDGRDWLALGYSSWDIYCQAEFGATIPIPESDRADLVLHLRHHGMSLRAIGSVTGMSKDKVARTVSTVSSETVEPPGSVTGVNGKKYATKVPIAATPAMAEMASASDDDFEAALAACRADGDLSEVNVLRHLPHVTHNSGENEWYTPPDIVNAARLVMGGIDLDPASSLVANEVLLAQNYYTIEDDGLSRPWTGRVWLNPPYNQPTMGKFCNKLIEEWTNQHITQAVVLVNNGTETEWFQHLVRFAAAICFLARRTRFWHPDRTSTAPLQGQVILYFGTEIDRFYEAFCERGQIVYSSGAMVSVVKAVGAARGAA